ncbi:hypothetical protein Taro_028932, partial [Colocasia esculenta]|nr:hypothetical protein [Colocasia esculenta]
LDDGEVQGFGCAAARSWEGRLPSSQHRNKGGSSSCSGYVPGSQFGAENPLSTFFSASTLRCNWFCAMAYLVHAIRFQFVGVSPTV